MRRVRAVARLARAVVHGLHGLEIVLFAFPSLDAAARQERIRWWARKMLAVLGIAFEHHGTPADWSRSRAFAPATACSPRPT